MNPTDLEAHFIQRVNVADIVRRSASAHGLRTALIDADESVSFRELNRQVDALATAFHAHGLQAGEHMLILSTNSIDTARAYFACARVGLVAVPVHPGLTAEELGHVLLETQCRAIAAESRLLATVKTADRHGRIQFAYLMKGSPGATDSANGDWPARQYVLGDLCAKRTEPFETHVPERSAVQCLYTSGSTGRPKGVLTSHVAVTLTAVSAAFHMRATESDVGLLNLPMNHVGGLNDSLIVYLFVGATGVIMPAWDPATAARLVDEHHVTIGMMSGPMWTQLLDAAERGRYSMASIRHCNIGMANLSPEQMARLRAASPNAHIGMASGQTEFTGYQEGQRPAFQHSRPLSWGAPTLMNEIEIMDEHGTLLEPGTIGEIVYRGPQAMNGYLEHPELTAESFRGGWFHTGDLGYVDEDHLIWFVDRKKDMIKTGGENVASQEVSNILMEHPRIAECAVVGLPHPKWSEAVTAFVCARSGAQLEESEVRDYCRTRLASFKVPKRVVFMERLPRSSTGKLLKSTLRQQYERLYLEASG